MSDSKPFEIRANLLHLAKDVLSENAHIYRDFQEKSGAKNPLPASQYTTDQIIAEAEKLYGFVTKK